MTRKYMNTRWCDVNVQVQCFECNVIKQGNTKAFAARLDEVYGEGTADMIKRRAQQVSKLTADEMATMADDMRRHLEYNYGSV